MRGVGLIVLASTLREFHLLRLIPSNTPHPSWRFAPISLLPQGEKAETHTSLLPRPLSRLAIVGKSGRRADRKAPHEFVRKNRHSHARPSGVCRHGRPVTRPAPCSFH